MRTSAETEREDPKFDEQPSVLQKLQKWGDYEAYGEAVSPTHFVPMKTPLGTEILENWTAEDPPRHPLSVASLLDCQEEKGRAVGMIIDLSNHETLYGADLRETGVRYERVPLVAKVFPTQHAVNKVIEVADRFWSEHPDLYIAIHCAYGFNRTGFVVCSYLIQVCNLTVQEALDSFAAARPPGVRHEQFVAELHKRYDGFCIERCPPSLSDLRGFANHSGKQAVGSLHSDFMVVAEHLQEHHPGITDRATGTASTQASSWTDRSDSGLPGTSPPIGSFQRALLPGRSSPAGGVLAASARSLDGATSNCESVNNESLDLDEREIFKHFANRQSAGFLPLSASVNGHHRRKGLKSVLPALRHSEDSSQGSSRGSPHAGPSPFATVQDSRELPTLDLRPDGDALQSATEEGAAAQNTGHSRTESAGEPAADPSEGILGNGTSLPTLRGGDPSRHQGPGASILAAPISERVFKGGGNGVEEGGGQPRMSQRIKLPCRIM